MGKELEKGSIVRVSIESKGDPSDTKDIEKMINDGLKQVLESSDVIKSAFFLEIREGRKRWYFVDIDAVKYTHEQFAFSSRWMYYI